jgi:hypothetical protein
MWTALLTIWWSNVVLAASPTNTRPHHYTYEVVVSFVGEKMVRAPSGLIYLWYYPKQSMIGH